MTTRLRVVHTTGFSYSAPVATSFNETRITPRGDSRQVVVAEHVDTAPTARQYRYTDYWGTQVITFDLHVPHDRLEVISSAVVETEDEVRPPEAVAADWKRLRSAEVVDACDEMLCPTPYTPHTDELAAHAREAAGDLAPAAAAEAVVARVNAEMRYLPGTTEVHTTAADAWERRSGVCQDYAHITLAMLRSLGIPARYVSGYLHPKASAAIGETVAGESHAWVEVWTGGWWGIDPTNATPVDGHHILIGTGRDYADVPPIKGIYTGGGTSELDVSVRITRLA
ncbi:MULTISPECIES: transglutaminase family protein [unclassified Gordonia (in: high G+C Gram-positive bacteria)]|uniref:transglutaminase family protein n=1 Tax=unclassified Gordonia (in: high G+C Gram-positive bacteria) TaxID=2657482 RepID=UPI001FFFC8CC|nr:transglutaminase family protein [Gordonia sp. PP30]UQE75131.1 transglutaminase family protein [Gordonia sp. PP30]